MPSFYRLRVDGRAGAARDDQRRAAEKELVDAVLVAVLGQLLEIENLAHAQAHGRDHHPVPRLVGLLGLVRPHLDAPGVSADGGDVLLLAPVAVLELHAGRVAARIAAPLLLGEAALHLAGADDDEIAAAYLDVLLLGALVEFVVGDGLAVLQPLDAAKASDVKEHAASDHLVLRVLDAEHVEPVGIDQLGVVAVVGLVLVKNVPERVPVGGALDAQVERVVGVAVERNAEREHLSGADEARRLDDVLGLDVVERADLVVLAPAAPILELLRRLCDRLEAHLDVHSLSPDCRPGAYTMRPRARKTTSGVIGISVIARAPSGRSASLTAFITEPGAPAVPASPAPLAPSSESAVGDTTWPISMSGISAAMGTR